MIDLSIIFLLFNEKIMFKSQLIKSNHRVLRKHRVDNLKGANTSRTIVTITGVFALNTASLNEPSVTVALEK
jgi:hypothetical protein